MLTPLRNLPAALCLAGGLLVAACSPGPGPSANVVGGPADGPATGVVALDNRFEPAAVRTRAGEEITVEIRNDGRVVHDFVIEDIELNSGLIAPGETVHATFAVPKGELEFVCTLHRGMNGVIEGE